jgi:hypothetical protein
MGIVRTYPGSLRKSGKQGSCGIPNLEEGTENGSKFEGWKVAGWKVEKTEVKG